MSARLTTGEIIRRLHIAMDAASEVPSEDIDSIEGLVQAGEWLIAFENLCTQLYEYDNELSREQVDLLVAVGEQLGADPEYWRDLPCREEEPLA